MKGLQHVIIDVKILLAVALIADVFDDEVEEYTISAEIENGGWRHVRLDDDIRGDAATAIHITSLSGMVGLLRGLLPTAGALLRATHQLAQGCGEDLAGQGGIQVETRSQLVLGCLCVGRIQQQRQQLASR